MSGSVERITPTYSQLGSDRCHPYRSAWGVFGEDDEVGTLQLADASAIVEAARLVRRGAVFSLNWRQDLPDPPILGRRPLARTIQELDEGPNPGTDDILDSFYTQASSQWDAFCHVGHPEYGYYNGRDESDISLRGGSQLGIDTWARRGIAGRFVLADVAGHRAAAGRPLPANEAVGITADELEQVLADQHVSLARGDVLLVRLGWIEWYQTLDEAGRRALLDPLFFPAPGLSPEERTAQWLWDHGIAAVATDTPALEAMPFDKSRVESFLHYRLVVFLGMAIGELFDLGALAADCARTGIYEGLLTAAPINLPGGAGSPANALAIK